MSRTSQRTLTRLYRVAEAGHLFTLRGKPLGEAVQGTLCFTTGLKTLLIYFLIDLLTNFRGTTGSYQKWADQVGDASYSFDSFESYFQKSPSLNQPNTDLRDANATVQNDPSSFSSNGGPLQVSYPNYADAISSWFAKALAELGLKPLAGLTSGKLFGFSYVLLTLDPATQTRSSSETSFLREAIQQTTNLYNYKSTLAKRILFTNNAASGVEVDSGGGSYNIGARKEVIVSAGAVS